LSPLKKNIAIVVVIFTCLVKAGAQVHDRYPSLFSQYYNHLNLINPAEIASSGVIEMNVGNQALTGDFNNIGNYFANISMALSGNDSSQTKHALSVNLLGEREGSLFSNTRVYIGYALKMKLSSKLHLALGISPGWISYMVKATANSGGASSQAFDANAGICLSSRKARFGLVLSQFPNTTITPIVEQLRLRRYVQLYAQHTLDLGMNVQLKSNAHASIQPYKSLTPNLTEQFLFKEILSVGLSYTLFRQYGFLLGIEKIPLLKGTIKTYFSFQMPVGNTQVAQNMNTLAIALGYTY
jgi:hypothetical protein